MSLDAFIGVPDWDNRRISSIKPVAEFIANKVVANKRTLNTSTDEIERQKCFETLAMSNAALSLLVLAYMTEIDDITDYAKRIMRETTQ